MDPVRAPEFALLRPATRDTRPSNSRLAWLDVARGIGIVFVVYAHAGRALFDVLPHLETFRRVDELIYAFHMPLFFFLAGLVSPRSLDRSRKSYVSGKLVTVVHPYLLWSGAYWFLEILFASRVNSQVERDAMLWVWLHPIEHLWFLYVLFICQLIAALMWPRAGLIALVAAWMLLGPLPPINVPALWTQFPWFVAGIFLAPQLMRADFPRLGSAGTGLSAAAACALLMSGAVEVQAAPLARFFAAGIGIALTVAASIRLRANGLLRYLGEASLTIYLLHTIFSAGTRELFEAVYPLGGLVLLAVTTVAGIVFPLVVHEIARRAGVAPYLGLGKLAPGSVDENASEKTEPRRSEA